MLSNDDCRAFAQQLVALDRPGAIPAHVCAAVAQHTLEIFAALFAGRNIPEMHAVLRAHARPRCDIAIPAVGIRSGLALAGAATAALAHAAEMEPIHAGTVICAAAVTLPALFAVAQHVQMSGARYTAAVCAGYEAAIRLGRALDGPALLSAGWWPTAICGSVAAAASAAIGLGLTDDRLLAALELAAVHSGGLLLRASAPIAREMLCAHTVRVGIDAALAAAHADIAGPREPFPSHRNFLTVFGERGDFSQLCEPVGERWAILETSLKRWPCALQTQSALDALTTLAASRRADATLERVEIGLPAAMLRIVDRPAPPATRWMATASLQFLAAAALLDGDIHDARLGAGRSEPRVLDLMKRIHLHAEPSLDPHYPQEWPATVRLCDSDGEVAAQCAVPPGHPARPRPFAFSEARFRCHAEHQLTADQLGSVVALVKTLDQQRDFGAVLAQLEPASA
jgi:2-methylcitrate dehydratase PrpD